MKEDLVAKKATTTNPQTNAHERHCNVACACVSTIECDRPKPKHFSNVERQRVYRVLRSAASLKSQQQSPITSKDQS